MLVQLNWVPLTNRLNPEFVVSIIYDATLVLFPIFDLQWKLFVQCGKAVRRGPVLLKRVLQPLLSSLDVQNWHDLFVMYFANKFLGFLVLALRDAAFSGLDRNFSKMIAM
jgi:hypothetical protein